MSDDEQPDDHLALLAKANGKAPEIDKSVKLRSDQNVKVETDARGNTVSTPILALMMAAALLGLVFGVLGFYAGNGADRRVDAMGGQLDAVRSDAALAHAADDKSSQARMEARLAQEDLIMLRAAVRASGIHVDKSNDHD